MEKMSWTLRNEKKKCFPEAQHLRVGGIECREAWGKGHWRKVCVKKERQSGRLKCGTHQPQQEKQILMGVSHKLPLATAILNRKIAFLFFHIVNQSMSRHGRTHIGICAALDLKRCPLNTLQGSSTEVL